MSEAFLAATSAPGFTALDGCVACRWLVRSDLVRLVEYRCAAEGPGLAAERHFDLPAISLRFSGAAIVRWGRRSAQSDSTRAILHEPGTPYTTSHPWGGKGCRGVFLLLEPSLAQELRHGIARSSGPSAVVATAAAQLRARRLVSALSTAWAVEPLDAESRALELARELLPSRREPRAEESRRDATRAMQQRSVERAAAMIQDRFREALSLAELAREAYASPDHLSRLFRRLVGLSVHQYQLRLRLNAALDWVCESGGDLSTLAHELGFSSHSHFTAAFRRAFGAAPSVLRRDFHRLRRSPRGHAVDDLRRRLSLAAGRRGPAAWALPVGLSKNRQIRHAARQSG